MESFRDLISYLNEKERMVCVSREVDPVYELTAVAKEICEKTDKAAYFEHVKGSSFPVVSYVLADREVVAHSLNMEPYYTAHQWSQREESQSKYTVVHQGPVQDIVDLQPDLRKLPLGIHSTGNNGRYITGGVVICQNPGSGSQNASFNRCQYAGPNKLRVRMMPPQHLGLCFDAAEKQGNDLPCAIVIGAPPSLMYSAASKIPFERDELEFAGALTRCPLNVVKCITNDVLVPAEAEIVIEGHVCCGIRESEGPFGEFTDGFVPAMENHVFHVDAITHRKDAVYHDIYAGGREDLNLLGLPIEAEIFNHIRKYMPIEQIKAVAALPFVFGAFISIHKSDEHQAKNILASAMTAYAWTKFVVVVDEDVDVYNPNDVLWAIQTRCCPEKDVIILPGVSSYTREDVKEDNIGKLGIDATAPLNNRVSYTRRKNPFFGKINLRDYVG